MRKTKTITLNVWHDITVKPAAVEYDVVRVTDSTEFLPGQILTKKRVDELCLAKDWKVIVSKRERDKP